MPLVLPSIWYLPARRQYSSCIPGCPLNPFTGCPLLSASGVTSEVSDSYSEIRPPDVPKRRNSGHRSASLSVASHSVFPSSSPGLLPWAGKERARRPVPRGGTSSRHRTGQNKPPRLPNRDAGALSAQSPSSPIQSFRRSGNNVLWLRSAPSMKRFIKKPRPYPSWDSIRHHVFTQPGSYPEIGGNADHVCC